MKVEELIIDGFKSYATRTVITDWDPQFNAITGLNGSGKSNILDAICFVLGISSMSTVRAQNLQDLIYKRGQAGVTKASVTIVFDNSDKKNSPIGFETHPKISITRQIILGGVSKYLINGHRAQQQTVLQLFQSVQLNINNPNFLIMQGKITKVLNMKPQEILSLIEEASGTRMFEDRREKAERTMAKKETKLQEIRTLLNEEIEPKLEKFRNEKRTYLEFQETQSDLENVSKVVNAFEYTQMMNKKTHIEETLKSGHVRIEELQDSISKVRSEAQNLNNDLLSLKKQRNDELHEGGKLKEFESEESKLSKKLSMLQSKCNIAKDDIKEEKSNLHGLMKNVEKWESEYSYKLQNYAKKREEYSLNNEKLENIKAQYKEKQELLSTLSTGISAEGTTVNGYTSRISQLKERLGTISLEVKEKEMESEMLRSELMSNEPKIQEAKSENDKNEQNIKIMREHCERVEAELQKLSYDPAILKELKDKERLLKNDSNRLSKEVEHLRRKVSNIEFRYSKPSSSFDPSSVKGVVGQLFSVDENNIDSSIALQVCAGGRLFNVVVDNEITASQLLEKGKLKKRVTIIPLNKIAARRVSESVTQIAKSVAPNKVELALDLIGYDEDVSRAMEFVFGSSFICRDADAAKKVTFNPNVRARSITLDGDVYDPEGTLSGGSRNNSGSLLVDIQKFNKASSHIKKIELELEALSDKIQNSENSARHAKDLQTELNLALHKLKLAEKSASESSGVQLIKRNEEIETQIEGCHLFIGDAANIMRELGEEMIKLQRDMNEFSRDKDSKLKELNTEVNFLSAEVERLDGLTSQLFDEYQNLLLDSEQLKSDTEVAKNQIISINDKLRMLGSEVSKLEDDLEGVKSNLNETQSLLEEERARLLGVDEEITELESLLKAKTHQLSQNEIELQKISNDLNRYQNNTTSVEQAINDLLQKNEWLHDTLMVESILDQNRSANIVEYKRRSDELAMKFQALRRKVNPEVMSMIESVEKKETALKTMIDTIEKDKLKIKETIEKLNAYKRETLIKTWEKVSVDFGNIFSDLLPNSFAKLEPSEGKDVTEGLEVKVKLGKIWKESLVELSGGQRSLIALSLILALLQFKPAPMYILDEVDAALDLSHTQNIGHLIKTRFKGSQFIVVSLKEGMFSNANRVFRTRFQDGTSVVSVM